MAASAGKSDPKSSSCEYIWSDKLSGDGFERYDWRRESAACSGHQLLAEIGEGCEVYTRPPRRRSVHPCFFFFFAFLFIFGMEFRLWTAVPSSVFGQYLTWTVLISDFVGPTG